MPAGGCIAAATRWRRSTSTTIRGRSEMSATERRIGQPRSPAERHLEQLLASVPIWQGTDIFYHPTFGGFSNSNWKIRLGGNKAAYFLKFAGEGTNRAASLAAGLRAYSLGIGPRPYDYLTHKGAEICDFVEAARPCTLREFHTTD